MNTTHAHALEMKAAGTFVMIATRYAHILLLACRFFLYGGELYFGRRHCIMLILGGTFILKLLEHRRSTV